VKQFSSDYLISAASSVHTIRTTGIDGKQSSTGQIKDRYCRILGSLRDGVRYESQGSSHCLIMSDVLSAHHSNADFFPDSVLNTAPVDLVCLPPFCYRDANFSENEEPNRFFLSGLVIQTISEFQDEYRRVGAFVFQAKVEKHGLKGWILNVKRLP
jgi:hypothetical protein